MGFTGRSCGARGCANVNATALGATMIDNPVDPSANIAGHVKRAVRSHREARGTMRGFGRRLYRSRKTIRKYFALAGCAVPGERLKNDVVATLRIGRAIP